MKKFLAGILALSMAVSSLAVTAVAYDGKDGRYADGYAVLGFASADWSAGMWGKMDDVLNLDDYQTPVQITGNGTYTVKVDLSSGYESTATDDNGDPINAKTATGIAAMGIQIWGLEASACDVTSVKFDGKEVALTGKSLTHNEDGGRRTNVYNSWGGAFKPGEDVSKDEATATNTLIDVNAIAEWATCEVTFDVYNLDADAAPAETEAAPAETEDAIPAETDAAAGDTTVKTDDKQNAETGIEGVAVVAGIALLATGAIIISRKRK